MAGARCADKRTKTTEIGPDIPRGEYYGYAGVMIGWDHVSAVDTLERQTIGCEENELLQGLQMVSNYPQYGEKHSVYYRYTCCTTGKRYRVVTIQCQRCGFGNYFRKTQSKLAGFFLYFQQFCFVLGLWRCIHVNFMSRIMLFW